MRNAFLLVALAASTSLACAANSADFEDEGAVDDAEGAATLSSTSTFYKIRPDYRRCVSPLCGGSWVSRLNQSKTKCADGSWAAECYVAEIDWSSAGLTQEDAAGASSLLFRGSIGFKTYDSFGNLGVLKATEVWSSPILEAPVGSFYRVKDTGIRCFRAPCLNLASDRLNSTSSRMISEFGGYYGPKAASYVLSQNILVAGDYYTAKNGGRGLTVSAFWTRVKHIDTSLTCTTDADCTTTVYKSAPATEADCYCRTCPSTIMNLTTEATNQAAYDSVCGGVSMMCPMVKCMAPPPVACVAGTCQKAL